MAFAGFSPGEAEGLRRAMSRKRSAAAIDAYHQRFVDGALRPLGRRRRGARRARLHDDRRLLGLRLPQGPRRGLRPARLPVDVAARPLRARVPALAARRAADGLLPARRPRPRGPAPRHPGPAPGRQRQRRRLHGRRRARVRGPRRTGRRPFAPGRGRRHGGARSGAVPPRPPRPASASGSATCSASAATRSRRSSRPGGPTGRSARSTTWRPARARGGRRSSAWPGRAPATRWPRRRACRRGPRGAWPCGGWAWRPRRTQAGEGTQLALPLDAAGRARPARARALGGDGRRLRDDRRDDDRPPASACCATSSAPAARCR